MQTTTSIKTLAMIGALSLFGGLAFADSHGDKMEDAATKADEATEAKAMAAEAVEEAKVKKEEAVEAQGEQFEKEEVGGITDFNNN
ncbi:MAG: hypothetical protein WBG92_02150 [Thiohalocapsa sp.]